MYGYLAHDHAIQENNFMMYISKKEWLSRYDREWVMNVSFLINKYSNLLF